MRPYGPQAGLRPPHHLGRHRHHRSHTRLRGRPRRLGRRRQPPRRLGLRRRRPQRAAPPPCSSPLHGIGELLKTVRLETQTQASSSAPGTPRKKASSGPPSGPKTTPGSSRTPSPTSTPTSASPAPTSAPPPSPRSSPSSSKSRAKSPAPRAASVYHQWLKQEETSRNRRTGTITRPASDDAQSEVGTLGSGSDFTPFIQHLGVPSTDIGSDGPYGVYHSVFDNLQLVHPQRRPHLRLRAAAWPASSASKSCTWPTPTSSPTTTPSTATRSSATSPKPRSARETATCHLDFSPCRLAARPSLRGRRQRSPHPPDQPTRQPHQPRLNAALRAAEGALLSPAGLPKRPWFKHTIYAPGEYTGYAAVVIPGVNEALDINDPTRASTQLTTLTEALNRAATTLEQAAKPVNGQLFCYYPQDLLLCKRKGSATRPAEPISPSRNSRPTSCIPSRWASSKLISTVKERRLRQRGFLRHRLRVIARASSPVSSFVWSLVSSAIMHILSPWSDAPVPPSVVATSRTPPNAIPQKKHFPHQIGYVPPSPPQRKMVPRETAQRSRPPKEQPYAA